jgi:hypothetical protein
MIQIITLIINPVNYYLMAGTNKRLLISESHGDLNRCTPCRGKPDQHDTYTFHANPRTPSVRFLRAVPVHGNLLRVIDRVGQILLLPRKSVPDSTSQPVWVAHGTHISFSPKTVIEAVGLSQAPVDGRLLGLPGPYHQSAIGTFNTCSQVPTHRSLTDTNGGYHIENLRIAIALSPSFPSKCSTDPLNSPARSQIIHTTFTNWTGEGTSPKSHEWEPPLDFYRNLSSKRSITNGKPPQDGGNKDKPEG